MTLRALICQCDYGSLCSFTCSVELLMAVACYVFIFLGVKRISAYRVQKIFRNGNFQEDDSVTSAEYKLVSDNDEEEETKDDAKINFAPTPRTSTSLTTMQRISREARKNAQSPKLERLTTHLSFASLTLHVVGVMLKIMHLHYSPVLTSTHSVILHAVSWIVAVQWLQEEDRLRLPRSIYLVSWWMAMWFLSCSAFLFTIISHNAAEDYTWSSDFSHPYWWTATTFSTAMFVLGLQYLRRHRECKEWMEYVEAKSIVSYPSDTLWRRVSRLAAPDLLPILATLTLATVAVYVWVAATLLLGLVLSSQMAQPKRPVDAAIVSLISGVMVLSAIIGLLYNFAVTTSNRISSRLERVAVKILSKHDAVESTAAPRVDKMLLGASLIGGMLSWQASLGLMSILICLSTMGMLLETSFAMGITVFLATVLPGAINKQVAQRWMPEKSETLRQHQTDYLKHTLSSVSQVRLAGVEEFVTQTFSEAAEQIHQESIQLTQYKALLTTITSACTIGALSLAGYWTGSLASSCKEPEPHTWIPTDHPGCGYTWEACCEKRAGPEFVYQLPVLFPCLILCVGFLWWQWEYLQSSQKVILSFLTILDLPTSPALEIGDKLLENLMGEIEFNNVSLVAGITKAAERLNLHILAGSRVGFLGDNESSSNLINYLLKLKRPPTGTITVDRIDIHDLEPVWLRLNFAVISSEVSILSLTVRDNLCFGCVDVADDELVEVLQRVGLPTSSRFLDSEAENLSSHQILALKVANGCLRDPRIVILMEPLQNIEGEESRIEALGWLKSLCEDRSTLVITHEEQLVRALCDSAVVVHEGRISDVGICEKVIQRRHRNKTEETLASSSEGVQTSMLESQYFPAET